MKTRISPMFTDCKKFPATYIFVFKMFFLIVTFGTITLKAEAFAGNNNGTIVSLRSSISTSEYRSLIPGENLTSYDLSVSRQIAVSPFNSIGKSATPDGAYASVEDNASGNVILNSNAIVSGSTAYFVMADDCASITPMTTTACNGVTFLVTPLDGTDGTVPSGTTYTWPEPTGSGFTGGEASTGTPSNISGTLENTTTEAVMATYTVTPTSGTCIGTPFTVIVTVFPAPHLTTNIPAPGTVCTGTQFDFTAASPTTGTSFSWSRAAITGISDPATSGTGNISGTLNNTSTENIPLNYVYQLTANGCTNTFTEDVIVTVVNVVVDQVYAMVNSNTISGVCPNISFDLHSSTNLPGFPQPAVLLSEDFETGTVGSTSGPNDWTTEISYTKGNDPTPSLWTIRKSPQSTHGVPTPYLPVTISSNTNNKFYVSDNSGNLSNPVSLLISPAAPLSMNTNGYTTLTLDFWHYYRDKGPSTGVDWYLINDYAAIDVSTDNFTTFTTVKVFDKTTGEPDNFAHETVNLSAFINKTNVRIRFRFQPTSDYYWAIDNIKVTGTSPTTGFEWTSSQDVPGFPNNQNVSPIGINQSGTTTYTAHYTDLSSTCTGSSPVTVTSFPAPAPAVISPAGSLTVLAGAEVQFTINSGKGNSRQWYLYGSPQSGDTAESYTTKPLLYFNPGTLFIPYQFVTLTTKDENGCRAISDSTIIHVDTIISNLIENAQTKANNFTARFAGHKITIFGSPENGARAWLYDMNGQKIGGEYRLTSAEQNEIPAPGLSSGTYFLRIENKTTRQTLKITVLNP